MFGLLICLQPAVQLPGQFRASNSSSGKSRCSRGTPRAQEDVGRTLLRRRDSGGEPYPRKWCPRCASAFSNSRRAHRISRPHLVVAVMRSPILPRSVFVPHFSTPPSSKLRPSNFLSLVVLSCVHA